MSKEEWISFYEEKHEKYPDIDMNVIQFIADFLCHTGDDGVEAIEKLFVSGYCYYFAVILKVAFKRGEICQAYPYGHIVWVDVTGIAYDITGIAQDYEEVIPIANYGIALNTFRHVPGEVMPTIDEEIYIVEKIREKLHEDKV